LEKEISIPIRNAYRIAIALSPVIILLFGIPYFICWHETLSARFLHLYRIIINEGRYIVLLSYFSKAMIALLAGIFLHEGLHGIGWVFFAENGIHSLKFGFTSPEMAPYAHCKDPLPVYAYRIGILLPGLILGILPAVAGIVTGRFLWLLFGLFFTWAASGDFIMLWLIRKLDNRTKIIDHPGKLGCIII